MVLQRSKKESREERSVLTDCYVVGTHLCQQECYHYWSTVRNIVMNHQRTTVIMTDEKDGIHHIRVPGTPEAAVKEIYSLLGTKDPLKSIHAPAGNSV